ncbi:hypothetical protein GJ496_007594 [Pomphorhynchus laevis]|nr:hypothetical protein GJ496_007594 [Pomphorhynchus laevis]
MCARGNNGKSTNTNMSSAHQSSNNLSHYPDIQKILDNVEQQVGGSTPSYTRPMIDQNNPEHDTASMATVTMGGNDSINVNNDGYNAANFNKCGNHCEFNTRLPDECNLFNYNDSHQDCDQLVDQILDQHQHYHPHHQHPHHSHHNNQQTHQYSHHPGHNQCAQQLDDTQHNQGFENENICSSPHIYRSSVTNLVNPLYPPSTETNKYEIEEEQCEETGFYSGERADQICKDLVNSAATEDGGNMCDFTNFNNQNASVIPYKIQYDPNPNVLKKHTGMPVACYRQHISVRYLQPPAPAPPGPIIIKEIRPPQPPPAPPIIVRQKPKEPKTPPPLILREKPPAPPCVPQAQVIVKHLPQPAPPPRQVVIERYPPLPPKPRDIIIEKWLPYNKINHRPVILQKAPPPICHKPTKNIIVQYIANRPKVDRVYKQLGIVQINPYLYAQHHGAGLIEPSVLQATAIKEGIIEAIVSYYKTF